MPPVAALSVKEASRQMDKLIDAFEAFGLKAHAAPPDSQIPLLDQAMDAAKKTFDFYTSLPRDVAVRVIPDRSVRELHASVWNVDSRLTELVNPECAVFAAKMPKALALLANMKAANAERDVPLDLTRMVQATNAQQQLGINWWEMKGMHAQRMLDIGAATARLPDTSGTEHQAADTFRFRHSGLVAYSNFAALEQRVAMVLREIDAGMGSAALAAADGELTHQLTAFHDDIQPAFQSIASAILSQEQQPQVIDTQNRVVLEAVLARLGEFASSVGDTLNALHAMPQVSPAQLEVLDKISEGAWMTASKLAGMLQATEPEAPQPAQASATEARAPRKKDKGKRKAAAGSSSQAARPAAPATARPAATAAAGASSSSGKTIVRSTLGTPRLVDSSEQQATAATAAAASTAAASAAALHLQPSKETLQHHLARLEGLIGFDLPAQRREVSQAYRDLSPENARFAVEQAVQNLHAQAGEMKASLTVLEDWRQLSFLPSAQVSAVHDKVQTLKVLHAEVQGVAKALQQGLEGSLVDRMKTYPFPTQAHIEELHKSGQLAAAEAPRALKGEPGTLFEVKLQPAPLRNGAVPRPVWLHIHTKEPVAAGKLATLGDGAFAATHVKSDTERGRNRQWQQARLREGHDAVMIHRGKITPELCRQLLGAGAT